MKLPPKLTYFLVRPVVLLFEWLPLAVGVMLGRALGALFYCADGRHRRITLENLQRALGKERSSAEIRRIARRTYRNLGASVAEIMKIGRLSAGRVKKWVALEGIEHYTEARAKGKGALFLSAHFGNWELLPIAFGVLVHRIVGVARPLDNPYLDELVRGTRERWGNQILSKRGAVREAMRLLSEGQSVGFLLDQNVSGRGGVFVPFFDQPASTNKSLALIALRTGAPVIPVFLVRDKGGHRIRVEKEVELYRSGDLEADILENTARFTQMIESQIRRHPDQWLWMHRRWKTQPPAGARPARRLDAARKPDRNAL